MGLLDALKSALGFGSSRDTEPDASSERAVKEPAAAGTDASASTGSMTEEPPETPADDDVAEAAEPAEAAGPASQVDPDVEADDADTGDAAGDEAAAHSEEATADTEESSEEEPAAPEEPDDGHDHVESISGIGPAYAKRLGDAGIESVAQLAAADADALADETGVSAKRIGRWIDRAEEY